MPIAMAQAPKGKVVAKIMMQEETTKIRPGGRMIKTKSNAISARVWGISNMSAPALEMQGL